MKSSPMWPMLSGRYGAILLLIMPPPSGIGRGSAEIPLVSHEAVRRRGADGKQGHLQGHKDDRLNIANVDLAGDIQGATCTAFDDIAGMVSRRWFD